MRRSPYILAFLVWVLALALVGYAVSVGLAVVLALVSGLIGAALLYEGRT